MPARISGSTFVFRNLRSECSTDSPLMTRIREVVRRSRWFTRSLLLTTDVIFVSFFSLTPTPIATVKRIIRYPKNLKRLKVELRIYNSDYPQTSWLALSITPALQRHKLTKLISAH